MPFRLSGLRARGLPPLPFVSSFLELNTRTYVTAGGKPGIWFFSLDASSELAVEAARLGYKLPYFRADIHHGPWPLQPDEAAIDENTMAPSGVEFTDEEPLLHFSARHDAVFWPLEDA